MLSRDLNGEVLRSEGLNVPPVQTAVEKENAKPYRMTWWWKYASPEHSKHKREVVDVSVPYNPLDETHQVRKLGVQKLAIGAASLNQFAGAHEQVAYTDTYHTSEIVGWWMATLNVWSMNWFFARAQSSGNLHANPRTRYAWMVVLAAQTIRVNIAGLIGAGGYFYSYEYLYTHGPKPFRIRDPTPSGWKRAWEDGQSTFLARAAASVFPALGYAFFMGRWKKAAFWFAFTLVTSEYYEYARRNVLSGTRLFYSFVANQELQRQADWGSLAPNLRHRVDPDTNRNASAAQFRYFRLTSGTLQNTIWENATHENLPLWPNGKKIPNPYFNWSKAPQAYEEKPWKVKNDLWSLPEVLPVDMRSGALDRKQ